MYRGAPDLHEPYLVVEPTDHTWTKTRSPQTNWIHERLHQTVLNESYRVAFRERLYRTLQAALDACLRTCNEAQQTASRPRTPDAAGTVTIRSGLDFHAHLQGEPAGQRSGAAAGRSCILESQNAEVSMSAQRPVIHSDPDILGGTPVFVGTRVPVQALLDYLEAGRPLAEFLDDFPTVTREQVVAALEQAKHLLVADARAPR